MLRIVAPNKNNLALPVVLGAVFSRNRLLLIKRNLIPFVGLWGMPGGKIHFGEHLDEAISREVLEECNIKTKWLRFCGVVTEVLHLTKNTRLHYLLHICKLKPLNFILKSSIEGEVRWFSLNDKTELKKIMIPSDFIMLNRLILANSKKLYYRCEVEKKNNRYIVQYFK
jgi:ADP-ribose pyrophosphatase YjhB (NUDIX family)